MIFDSIGFDLDGTLWDFTENVCRCWTEVLVQEPDVHTYPTAEMIRICSGMTREEYLPRLLPDIKDPVRRMQVYERCNRRGIDCIAREGGMLFPDTEEMLRTLSARYPLFIASNCEHAYLDNFLTFYDFARYFADVIAYGDTLREKGENIRALMDRNGFQNTLYVGDTRGDYLAAQKAGAAFVHAGYGFGAVPEARWRIQTRLGLVALLDLLEAEE